MKKLLSVLAIITVFTSLSVAQNEVPKKEFRGIWMATVYNLDYPQSGSLPPSLQKIEMRTKFDELKEHGINVIYFQIRTEGDALYDSDIEPWSKYITGEEGREPSSEWDPLAYAIKEAHKRGMELHAWLNPYRAMTGIPSDFTQKKVQGYSDSEVPDSYKPFLDKYYDAETKFKNPGTSQRADNHVSNTHPEWLMVMNQEIAIFDPGLPEVIDYTIEVVMDVVNRYDVDGIHFDDYFYPYPQNHMGSNYTVDGEIVIRNDTLDDKTFEMYPRGFTDKDDWRRNNIDIFVEALHDSIQVVKPWVKFGISPFGIWKNGTPSGISGMDAFDVIYGDGITWLQQQTIDYITPQLYWEINRFGPYGTDYKALANWWADSAAANNRHIYPGHGLYRSDSRTYSNTLFKANEVTRQMQINRDNPKIQGSVFFRSKNITNYSSKGFGDSLKTNYYKYAALQPTMEWKSMTKPDTPENLVVTRDSETDYMFNISWNPPSSDQVSKISLAGHVDSLVKYAVYRVDSGADPDEVAEMQNYYNLIEVTGDTTFTDIAPPSENGHWYFVTTVNRNNIESDPTPAKEGGIVVSNDEEVAKIEKFSLAQNYPNPFNPSTEINFNLSEAGFTSLKVYDMLGREVSTLVSKNLTSGSHSISFDASNLASGIYIYRLTSRNKFITRRMTLIK